MKSMTYGGYTAKIEYHDGDEIFFGFIAGIRDGIGFHVDNVADLRAAFQEAVDDYIDMCAKIGKSPQPYSGNLMLRIDPMVHSKAAFAAELAGKSLNKWSEEVIDKAASKREAA
jgi:predicted HicB family RNase H-like nuclease